MKKITIPIASEHALLRQAMAVAFEQKGDLSVVGKTHAASSQSPAVSAAT